MMSLRGAFVQRRIDLFEKLPKTITGLRAFFLSCAAFLFAVDGGATEFSTLVVSVIDGDTIEVLQYQKRRKPRHSANERSRRHLTSFLARMSCSRRTARTGMVTRSRTCSYRMEEK
jgi:endonuclease YncB( thermonuclease family)